MRGELLLINLLLFGSFVILLALGLPVVFCLFGISIVGLLIFQGSQGILVAYYNLIGTDRFWLLITVPLFVFMAGMLESSGVAEDLYNSVERWSGGVGGGLAMGTIVMSTIVAAMVGLSSATILAIGIIALPAMLRRGYDRKLALGVILAGGTLDDLIPPSVLLIVYAAQVEEGCSIGKLFLGGIMPGLLLASLYIIYIAVLARFKPALAPPLRVEERASLREKIASLRALVLPAILVVAVLGSIYAGIATPSEAASLGAFGAIVCASIYRRLTWQKVKEISFLTLKLSCMIMWILLAARCFIALYYVSGAPGLLEKVFSKLPFGGWGALIIFQVLVFVLGCFLDPFGVVMIAVPIAAPVLSSFGFDPIWYGIVFVINLEMSYLTPPVGLNVFYIKGIAPEDASIGEIYRAAVPFIIIQGVVLVITVLFPELVLWLPNALIR